MKLNEFYDLQLYEQEAVFQSAVNYIEEQNNAQKKTLKSLTDNLNSTEPNSHLASMNSPKFQFE